MANESEGTKVLRPAVNECCVASSQGPFNFKYSYNIILKRALRMLAFAERWSLVTRRRRGCSAPPPSSPASSPESDSPTPCPHSYQGVAYYRVTHLLGMNLQLTWIWHVPPSCLAWAVSSYSNGSAAARTLGTKPTGGFYQADVSPCR